MEHIEGLLWSLVFLLISARALSRIVGWRELEALATRAAVAVVLLLFTLPILRHEASTLRDGIATRSVTCAMPSVVVVGTEHLAAGALVVAGHVVLGLWILRRRARGENAKRVQQQREADRRRERVRLPPRDLNGGAS